MADCGCGCKGRGDCLQGAGDGVYGFVGAVGTNPTALYDLDKQRKRTARAATMLAQWAKRHLIIDPPQTRVLENLSVSGEPTSVGYMVRMAAGDANTRFLVNRKARELAFWLGTRSGSSVLDDGRVFVAFSNVPERYVAQALDPQPMPALAETTAAPAPLLSSSGKPIGVVLDADDEDDAEAEAAAASGLVAIGHVGSIFTKIGDAFKRKPEGIRREIAKLERRIAALKGRLGEMEKQDESDEAAGFEPGVGGFPEDNAYFVSVLKMADEAQDFALRGDLATADELVGLIEDDLEEVGRLRRKTRRRRPLRRSRRGSQQRRRRLLGLLKGSRRRGRGRAEQGAPSDMGGGGGDMGGGGGGDTGGEAEGDGYSAEGDDGSYEENITLEETFLSDVDPEEEEIAGLFESSGMSGGTIPARELWRLSPTAFQRAISDPYLRQRII